ncbi:MAG: zf-HC2 domain-containing protein [Heliobacteriaceae bacterium]|nr:zf-HC2 domain-containing protein [Heliobacteriaceae bacterium]MDD4588649.1 zf-HC2 domain-containing protein [Heliobacteriaceae bacterium]
MTDQQCRRIRRRLNTYLTGELPASEQAMIKEHLARCPHCTAELTAFRHLEDLFRSLPMIPAPPDLMAGIMNAVTKTSLPEMTWRQVTGRILGILFSYVFLILGGYYLYLVNRYGWEGAFRDLIAGHTGLLAGVFSWLNFFAGYWQVKLAAGWQALTGLPVALVTVVNFIRNDWLAAGLNVYTQQGQHLVLAMLVTLIWGGAAAWLLVRHRLTGPDNS